MPRSNDVPHLRGVSEYETLRLAMRGARLGSWMRDLVTDEVTWSPELEDLFGLRPGTFGRSRTSFLELIHPEDVDSLSSQVDRAVQTGGDYAAEFRFRHASGEWRWMDGRGRAEYDADGRPLRLHGVGIDITDRKRAEGARDWLAALVESSTAAVVGKRLDGTVTSWNVGAVRLFGYSAEEMIGTTIFRIVPPELHGEEHEVLRRVSAGERVENYETERVERGGRRRHVQLAVSPVRNARGEIVGASKVAFSIDERRMAEAALRESELRLKAVADERERLLDSERAARSEAERLGRVKDEFLATLSHELRTPLNAIQGWAMLLRQPQITDSDRERGLASIERNTRAQAQIINDLLDMSRIISGKIPLELATIDLREVINAAIEAVLPAADARRVTISSRFDVSVGPTRADPNRLQQVMWNLLSNAVKFTPAEGRVLVTLQASGPQLEIVVQDSGIGIRPEFLPFVFDRFRQADASTTRRYGGLGLGLSIVRSLVEMHGGTVHAESDGENAGSRFVVTLPLSHTVALHHRRHGDDRDEAMPEPIGEPLELPRLDGARILVVDDERDTRELVERILEERGAQAVPASSAREALQLLEGGVEVHLLLSDIGMPDLDGYGLIRRVRELEGRLHRRHLPAIAATAYARSEDRQRSLMEGYQVHIAKPVEPRELIAAISSLLRMSANS